ncbi:DUF6646 family protein [Cochleicola gelatinilyticus]|uniref:Outer membrane protein beta-barrel domain-containing protein n=1 Tax=Cochleicola gelatinilyticus TaxID=1763537 RepID=A0A167IUA3_9FLAO|nr:DUF6646 family protein [Cochleicola gelatinilyticus]OAB80022.1 hypothetical protein ULVI_04590 [Cochleicola gelatinilyticus]
MKQLLFIFCFFYFSVCIAQSYSGKGDVKFQVGAQFQEEGTGIGASLDFGFGENISLGVFSSYVLNVDEILGAEFQDRFELQGRFNAHLGNVLNIDPNFDVYPGLYVGLRNFGGHLGLRYFFTSGFGVFTELRAPFSKYNTEALTPAEQLNNQFTMSVGASFNL